MERGKFEESFAVFYPGGKLKGTDRATYYSILFLPGIDIANCGDGLFCHFSLSKPRQYRKENQQYRNDIKQTYAQMPFVVKGNHGIRCQYVYGSAYNRWNIVSIKNM